MGVRRLFVICLGRKAIRCSLLLRLAAMQMSKLKNIVKASVFDQGCDRGGGIMHCGAIMIMVVAIRQFANRPDRVSSTPVLGCFPAEHRTG
jgi:hypothetical protein